jgi:hypothetical protein
MLTSLFATKAHHIITIKSCIAAEPHYITKPLNRRQAIALSLSHCIVAKPLHHR